MRAVYLGCIWTLITLALILAGCHGGANSVPAVPQHVGGTSKIHPLDEVVGDGGDPIVCDRTATPNPSNGSWGNYNCFLKPNSTLTVSGLQMSPWPTASSAWTCSQTSWAVVPYTNMETPPPFISGTVSPAVTGGGSSCQRLDTVSVTLSTGNVPADFGVDPLRVYGSFTACLGSQCYPYNEEVTTFTLFPGLHIRDVELAKHVENQDFTHVAGQHMDIKAELSGPANESFGAGGCTWAMPSYFTSDAVSSYVTSDTATSASPVPSTPIPSGTSPSDVTWYNTRAESDAQIGVSCDVIEPKTGTSLTLTSHTNVQFKTPAPTVQLTYGSVSIDSTLHDAGCVVYALETFLTYGDPCSTPGIRWSYNVAADSDEASGKIATWQVISAINNVETLSDGTSLNSAKNNCADGKLPYEGQSSGPVSSSATWIDVDAPALNLMAAGNPFALTAHATATFDDYYMYRAPPGPITGSSSIWISLGHSRWGWDAATSYASPTPAPSNSPDSTHYTGPNVVSLPQPSSIQDTAVATPIVPSSCTF